MGKFIGYDKVTGSFEGFAEEEGLETLEVSDEVYTKILFSNKICKINISAIGSKPSKDMSVAELLIEEAIPLPPKTPVDLFKDKMAGKEFRNWSSSDKDALLEVMAKFLNIIP